MKRLLLPAALAAVTLPGCATDTSAGSAPASAPESVSARPNILLIVSEDHGPELACYGDPFARTPVLDRLAGEGMRFDRAYVVQAGCSPSRASIHTGLYAHQHGQVALSTWGFRMYSEDTPNLPRSLKEVGYRTGIIGKLHVEPASAFRFEFTAMPSGNFAREDLPGYARHAAEFMGAGDGPFFLAVNYPDAHFPWQRQVDSLPPEPLDPEDVAVFSYFGVDTPELRAVVANHYNSIMRLDSLVGDLLAVLEAQGKAENTFVVFLSDHGPDIIRGKRTVFEGGTHVPLIIRWPAEVEAGLTSRALIESTDLMPTILELAGAPPVPGLPGKSLLPLLRRESVAWRQYLFTEFHAHTAADNFNPQRAVRDDRYKLIKNLVPGVENPIFTFNYGPGQRWGFDSAYHAAMSPETPVHVREMFERMRIQPPYELYDLWTDPNEFHNLAEDPAYAETFARLRHALQALRERSGDPLLDPAILEQFREEVLSIRNQQDGRNHEWRYRSYFFPDLADFFPTIYWTGEGNRWGGQDTAWSMIPNDDPTFPFYRSSAVSTGDSLAFVYDINGLSEPNLTVRMNRDNVTMVSLSLTGIGTSGFTFTNVDNNGNGLMLGGPVNVTAGAHSFQAPTPGRTIELTNDSTWTISEGALLSFSHVLSGPYDLVKAGRGTLLITGNQLHTGDTVIGRGVFGLGNAPGSLAGDLSFGPEARLRFNPARVLGVMGKVSFEGGFGIGNVDGLPESVAPGSYPLITGHVDTANLRNIGLIRAAPVGPGRWAFFEADGGLTLTVVDTLPDILALSLRWIGFDANRPVLEIDGPAGETFTIETSTDLKSWENVDSLAPPTMPAQWTDPATLTVDPRFYRMRLGEAEPLD